MAAIATGPHLNLGLAQALWVALRAARTTSFVCCLIASYRKSSDTIHHHGAAMLAKPWLSWSEFSEHFPAKLIAPLYGSLIS